MSVTKTLAKILVSFAISNSGTYALAQKVEPIIDTEGYQLLTDRSVVVSRSGFWAVDAGNMREIVWIDQNGESFQQRRSGVSIGDSIRKPYVWLENGILHLIGRQSAEESQKALEDWSEARTEPLRELSFSEGESTNKLGLSFDPITIYSLDLNKQSLKLDILKTDSYSSSATIQKSLDDLYFVGSKDSNIVSAYSLTEAGELSQFEFDNSLSLISRIGGVYELALLREKGVLVLQSDEQEVQFIQIDSKRNLGTGRASETGEMKLVFFDQGNSMISLESFVNDPKSPASSSVSVLVDFELFELTFGDSLSFSRKFSYQLDGLLSTRSKISVQRFSENTRGSAARVVLSNDNTKVAVYSRLSQNVVILEIGDSFVERKNVISSGGMVENVAFSTNDGKGILIQTDIGLAHYAEIGIWDEKNTNLKGTAEIREAQRILANLYKSDPFIPLVDGVFGPETHKKFERFSLDSGIELPNLEGNNRANFVSAAQVIIDNWRGLDLTTRYSDEFGFISTTSERIKVLPADGLGEACEVPGSLRFSLETALLDSAFEWLPVVCKNIDSQTLDDYPLRFEQYFYRNGGLIASDGKLGRSFIAGCEMAREIGGNRMTIETDIITEQYVEISREEILNEILSVQKPWKEALRECS